MNHFYFLDFETTGTGPESDYLLEVGVLRDDGRILLDSLITPPEGWQGKLCEYVSDMHSSSGLTADLLSGEPSISVRDAEERLLELIPPGAVLAGYSVHFDRAFIRAQMPRLDKHLGHRLLDISTVKALFRAYRPGVPEYASDSPLTPHRALNDCLDALAVWRYYGGLLEA